MATNKPHPGRRDASPEERLAALAPSAASDFAAAQAARRWAKDRPGGQCRPSLRIGADTVREPMFLLLLAAETLYLVFGERQEELTLSGLVVIAPGFTLCQERKTERAINALRGRTSRHAIVIRDGQPQRVAGRDVERGDLLRLSEGDRVPAGALVVVVNGVRADELLLTGDWPQAVPADMTMTMLLEEYPVMLTLFPALGARGLSKEGVLTRRINAIKTLGATKVLSSDKTGTLTEGFQHPANASWPTLNTCTTTGAWC